VALTRRQQRFVEEYLIDLNGTQAAIRAGYSKRTAAEAGYENLRKPQIAEAIETAQKARSERTEITADRVLTELALLGFANMADYTRLVGTERVPHLTDATRDQLAAVQEITVEDFTDGRGEDAREVKRVKLKLADKRPALVDIGRHLGMFKERHEHTGKDGAPLVPPVTDPSRLALALLTLFNAPTKE